jgi:hypothetical protein
VRKTDLQELDDIGMLDQLHGGDFPFDLLDHLVLQDLLLVQDFDGDVHPRLDVPGHLHFGKCALPQRLAEVILPNPRAFHVRRHPVCIHGSLSFLLALRSVPHST